MQQKPLHEWLPRWILSIIENSKCIKCNSSIHKNEIAAIGVRKAGDQDVFYVEYTCSSCENRAIHTFKLTNRPTTLEELCFQILKFIQEKKISLSLLNMNEGNDIKNKEPINNEELQAFMDFQKTATFDDLLRAIQADKVEPINLPDKEENNES